MKAVALLFDLDGTLLNTLGDLTDAVNAALEKNGFAVRKPEEVRSFIGDGVELLMRRALPEKADEETVRVCLACFKAHYAQHMQQKTAPYPHIVELLVRLRREGFRIAVISNKFHAAVQELCEQYFPGLIDVAIGESDDTPRKPHPGGLLKAMALLQAEPECCVYIGDSPVDVETARNAGVRFAGVSWGFRTAEALREAGACEIAAGAEELYAILTDK